MVLYFSDSFLMNDSNSWKIKKKPLNWGEKKKHSLTSETNKTNRETY